jgi:hypothetical protein
MSFKDRLLYLYQKYNLEPTSLSSKLGYKASEKISRLTRDGVKPKNPSIHIIEDILKAFPEINARWLITGENDILAEESLAKYGICDDCKEKNIIIKFLKEECAAKDKKIDELLREAERQTDSKKEAS